MILNPSLNLEQAAAYRMAEIKNQYSGIGQWQQLKPLERVLLRDIAGNSNTSPYSQESRSKYAALLGVESISNSSIQTAIKSMTRRELISRNVHSELVINNPLFQTWILENI